MQIEGGIYMLKERKIQRKDFLNKKDILGYYNYPGYYGEFSFEIELAESQKEINHEEYYIAEITGEGSSTDGHTTDYGYVNGVLLAFNLNLLNTSQFIGYDIFSYFFNKEEFEKEIRKITKSYNLLAKFDTPDIEITSQKYLKIILPNRNIDDEIKKFTEVILNYIRDYFENLNFHITRMFGSYICLANINNELQAILASKVPIEYCPLMIKLLKEVGGENANSLLTALKNKNKQAQKQALIKLINEVVIQGGYFDTNRPLNSCEANVLFGASETMASAFQSNMIDASVIVSNNLGTIITTNEYNTQGAVKRMTGLFYTSPSKNLVETAIDAGIIPVFPYTAEIDQLEGVKKAISLGYKNIAVSVAAQDNYLHEHLTRLEQEYNVNIYKFGLCSTGISQKTAITMRDYADVVWSCASLNVKEYIEPNSIAQVGVKIPVYIMTEKGWNIVQNHLYLMNNAHQFNPELTMGDERPVFLNQDGMIRERKKKDIRQCSDCPHPCV